MEFTQSLSLDSLTWRWTLDTLFFAPGTCAMASHIALAEAHAHYRVARLDFSGGEQHSNEYLAINPKGRVPALATRRGVLTETPAILLYVAQMYPDAGLAPLNDPFALAKVQEFNNYLCSTVHVAHAHRMRGTRWVDDAAALAAMKAKVPKTVGDCFEFIEHSMFGGPWVMGDAYTICDAYLFTVAGWLESDGIEPQRFPGVLDHRTRMSERAAVRRAQAEQRDAPSFRSSPA